MNPTNSSETVGHTAMLMSREEIEKLRDETVAGIEGLNQIRHPIPPEATEMLRAYATCLHWMDLALARDDKVLRCAFCGYEYPDGTPSSKSSALAAHIRVCPDHSDGDMPTTLNQIRTALSTARTHLPKE